MFPRLWRNVKSLLPFTSRSSGGYRKPQSPRYRPQLDILEDRLAPSVTAGLSGGTLTVTLGAAGDYATLTGTTTVGNSIQVAGTGFATTTFGGVTALTVQDGGGNAGQSVALTSAGSNAIILPGNITVTGIESVTLSTSTTLQANSFVESGAAAGVNLSANVTTAGTQTYDDAVTLGTNATLTASTVTFGGTLNAAASGGEGLVINGNVVFDGIVGGTNALSTLAPTGGTTVINTSAITTTQYTDFLGGDSVILGTDTTINGGALGIFFGGTLDGAYNLMTNTSGNCGFAGIVGELTPLLSITTTSSGTTFFDTSAITTSGNQTYNDPVSFTYPGTSVILSGNIITAGPSAMSFVLGASGSSATNTIKVVGTLALSSTTTLVTTLAGTELSQYGHIVSGSSVNLNGAKLSVNFADFTPTVGDKFVIASAVGQFSNAPTGQFTQGQVTFQVSYEGGACTLTVGQPQFAPAPPAPPSPLPPPVPLTPSAPATQHIVVAAAGPGAAPLITVYDAATGAQLATFFAFTPSFAGGVRVAVDDINGDGVPDIICAAGPGGGPQVEIIDGTKLGDVQANGEIDSSAFLANFEFTASGFAGGVFVAAATSSTGQNWVVAAAGPGGSPQVTIYTASALLASPTTPTALTSIYATARSFTGGIHVAVGDVFGTGNLDVIIGAGSGGLPQISVIDSAGTFLSSFYFTAGNFTNGVFVSGGVNGSGQFVLVGGAGPGAAPQVGFFAGSQLQGFAGVAPPSSAMLASFYPFPITFTGGVEVGFSAGYGSDGAILVTPGSGGGPEVAPFDAVSFQALSAFFAASANSGGMFVAGN
jgi:hypothetical protein